MNSIQKINKINQKELENNVSDSASWHADYKDTSYIYIGFLPFDLNEMDIVKIFSQYGIPTHINLIKDKETGKSRGFCYLKYEDYRSCVLAIDNFNGIQLRDKKIKVDHVYYHLKDGQNEDDFIVDYTEAERELKEIEDDSKNKETRLIENKSAPEDPMAEYVKSKDDEFVDPMESYLKNKGDDDDDFTDPMAAYIKSNEGKHKTSRHKHRHRYRSERSRDRSSREKSPSGRSHRDKSSTSRSHRDKSPSSRSDKSSTSYRNRDSRLVDDEEI
mmetsp:Transcript_7065/g.8949  ORF Transcript_7065/g.8949 Transcript_7065/m.8949 type:complete len:273 (+) Transcript_7065:44-862(+)